MKGVCLRAGRQMIGTHLDVFIKAVPVPLLEECKGHLLLHNTCPDSVPQQVPLIDDLTPPAQPVSKVIKHFKGRFLQRLQQEYA